MDTQILSFIMIFVYNIVYIKHLVSLLWGVQKQKVNIYFLTRKTRIFNKVLIHKDPHNILSLKLEKIYLLQKLKNSTIIKNILFYSQ